MLSSGRPCLRRRLSVVFDTTAAGPDEPLLFLYPRWAASALQRHQIASLTPAAASANRTWTSGRSLSPEISPSSSPSSFRRQSGRWFSSKAAAKPRDGDRSKVPLPRSGAMTLDGKDLLDEGARSRSVDTTSTKEPKRPLKLFAGIELTTPVRGPITWKSRKRNANNSHSRPLASSTHGLIQKADSPWKMSVRDRRKLRYGTFIKEKRGDGEQLPHQFIGGWDSMKDILERGEENPRAGSRRSHKQKELHIPEETVALMAGTTEAGMAENIYYVAVRNGCRVHILHPREGNGIHRKVILSGSERAIELVEDSIMRGQTMQNSGDPLVEIAKPPFPIFTSIDTMRRKKLPVPMVRGVWTEPEENQMGVQELIDHRPSPTTVKEFAEYIEDLTRAREPNAREKVRSGTQTTRRDLVASRILQLFRQDSNQQLFSSAALNQALVYLCDQELLSTARAIVTRAEHVATADTYNILLRAAARRQDLKTFRRFLVYMNRVHIRPNPETWLVLLEAMVTPSAKAALVTHMVQKGHLAETGAIRTALQLTIQDSLQVHLQNGQNVESFIGLMVKTYGANWFSASLLSQMFSVISRRDDFTAANELLKFCFDNQLQLNNHILNSIIAMCYRNIFSAIDYTLLFLRQPNFRISRLNLEYLFRSAFKGQKYNICRVLWRYACLYGFVTTKMKETVFSSLRRNESLKKYTDDASKLWQVNSGKVIVGLEMHLPRRQGDKPLYPDQITDLLPSEFRDNPFSYLTSGFKPQGEERDLQLHVAYMVMKRDIKSGSFRYSPEFPLSVMLESAAILDREWHRKPMPLSWTLQNAIQVPLRRLPGSQRSSKS